MIDGVGIRRSSRWWAVGWRTSQRPRAARSIIRLVQSVGRRGGDSDIAEYIGFVDSPTRSLQDAGWSWLVKRYGSRVRLRRKASGQYLASSRSQCGRDFTWWRAALVACLVGRWCETVGWWVVRLDDSKRLRWWCEPVASSLW